MPGDGDVFERSQHCGLRTGALLQTHPCGDAGVHWSLVDRFGSRPDGVLTHVAHCRWGHGTQGHAVRGGGLERIRNERRGDGGCPCPSRQTRHHRLWTSKNGLGSGSWDGAPQCAPGPLVARGSAMNTAGRTGGGGGDPSVLDATTPPPPQLTVGRRPLGGGGGGGGGGGALEGGVQGG